MKLRVYLVLALALFGCPKLARAQQSGKSASTISGTPWVANRAIGEGAGIKTGNVEWHPGISAEFGYDSNYLQRATSEVEEQFIGPVVPALRLRVTPQLSIRTLDRRAESEDTATPPPAFLFDLSGAASYNEIIALKEGYGKQFSDLRNLEGGGGLDLRFFEGRVWSADLSGAYNYIFEPSNQGGFGAQFSRHVISGGAGIKWAPGGGRFKWDLLRYGGSLTIFDDRGFRVYNNINHAVSTSGSWKFLPKTALLYDGRLNVIRYGRAETNDGEALQARMGLNGLLTKRLGFLGMAGWATSFYHASASDRIVRNYDSVIGQAELKWYLSSDGQLQEGYANVGASAVAVGYARDFNDSYLADFFKRDRVYGQMSYLIGGQVITTVEVGGSFIGYPDSNLANAAGGYDIQDSFNETRIDVQGFVEYRPVQTIGINLQVRYDQNLSTTLDFRNGDDIAYQDDLDFQRFRAMLGVRWFL